MAESSDPGLSRVLRIAVPAAVVIAFCWAFPLFHVVPLAPSSSDDRPPLPSSSAEQGTAPVPGANAVSDFTLLAAKIWKSDLLPAASRATELTTLLPALRASADTARTRFGKSPGVGAYYYFVRGSGKIVGQERSSLRVVVDGAENEIVALRVGPVFGNTVRDGTGLLDVNAFSGLQEFNALSAELNALVEKNVLPVLRENAIVGALVQFVGCAEAPESAADVGETVLTIVPLVAEVR
jgi:predicted lipoprotein